METDATKAVSSATNKLNCGLDGGESGWGKEIISGQFFGMRQGKISQTKYKHGSGFPLLFS
ncbi:hypothetical protein [Stutzerimonas stutzeri]|uniref:Uncharacterized protein n=1 Tax=Stutzerimonas stutzeri TaxID=316 RepID=A0A6I6LQK4_STUST|nr:hypothetical protein [Stutzerimonas stutzeri]QGZ31480.1 hypothetical protein GQA94_15930 [Stutzerimonas stutzeri]